MAHPPFVFGCALVDYSAAKRLISARALRVNPGEWPGPRALIPAPKGRSARSSPAPTPTSLYLPAPTHVHIRNETRLCWDFNPDALFYDFWPKNLLARGSTEPPAGSDLETVCHEFGLISSDVDELCVSVADYSRSSPWVCRSVNSPTPKTDRPSMNLPEVRLLTDDIGNTYLCWDRPDWGKVVPGVSTYYIGWIGKNSNDKLPIKGNYTEITPHKKEGQDCIVFPSAIPEDKICVAFSTPSETVALCQQKPFPPRPNEPRAPS